MKKWNALLLDWNCNSQGELEEALKEALVDVDMISWKTGDYEENPPFEQELEKKLKCTEYDFVISFDYFPVVSKVCEREKVIYISWVYDCPHLTLYSKTVFHECNYIFLFDSVQYREFQSYGLKHIFYLPMAVNVKRIQKLFGGIQRKWSDQISFVGSLYENNLYDQINFLPKKLKGYLEGLMQAQKKVYGYNFLEELLDDACMKEVRKYVSCGLDERFFVQDKRIFADLFLGEKVTNTERIELLEEVAKTVGVTLYTGSQVELSSNIKRGNYLDYSTQMPVVFQESKINLNISLRSITAGVPLRVFDILGAGGFLITNYQSDLLENGFVPGEDLVIYESKEDLVWKVAYYLEHEEERMQIAENGWKKVAKMHTYENRIKTMLDIVEREI